MMALIDARVVAAKPNAADRKATVSPALGNAGLLKQRQRAAPRSDENKLGRHRTKTAGARIFDLNAPATAFRTIYAGDAAPIMNRKSRRSNEMIYQMVGERAVVDVRARDDPRLGNGPII